MNYAYDGLGRRAYALAYNSAGTAHRDRTFYTYYQNNLIEERIEGYSGTSFAGNIIYKSYIYGGGLSGMDSYNSPSGGDDVAMILQKYVKKTGNTSIANVTLYYTERDHLGSIDKIYDESGATIEEYTYTPYGGTYIKNQYTNSGGYTDQYIPIKLYTDTLAPTVQNSSTGTLYKNNRLFTGREYDSETGLYYLRARHYDPHAGRFLQPDPIGTSDDINLYRYVKNNPINFTDRFGLNSAGFDRVFRDLYNQGYTDIYKDIYNEGQAYKQATQELLETLPISGDINDVQGLFTSKSLYSCKPILGGAKAITILGAVLPFVTGGELRAVKNSIWSSTKSRSSVENAFQHWTNHKGEFPELENATQYVKKAQNFFTNPPSGTLKGTRTNGDNIFYDPTENLFGVTNKNGTPKTFFKPDAGINYFLKQ